jgi:hypothetical protein
MVTMGCPPAGTWMEPGKTGSEMIWSFRAACSAGMGFGAGKTSWHAAVALVAGVFAGSAACWLVLSLGSPGLGSRLGPRQIWGG